MVWNNNNDSEKLKHNIFYQFFIKLKGTFKAIFPSVFAENLAGPSLPCEPPKQEELIPLYCQHIKYY